MSPALQEKRIDALEEETCLLCNPNHGRASTLTPELLLSGS
jgi:hypothetical protein